MDLGVLQYVLGNSLFLLFRLQKGVLSRPKPTMQYITMAVKTAASNLGVPSPVNKLTLLMIKQDGKAPKLRTKAATTRYMLPIVAWIFENMHKPTDAFTQVFVRQSGASLEAVLNVCLFQMPVI